MHGLAFGLMLKPSTLKLLGDRVSLEPIDTLTRIKSGNWNWIE
jgi:hypothetical protein